MIDRALILARIKARKALGLRVRRRALPRQLRPDTIILSYAEALSPFLEEARRLVEREVLPAVERLSRLDGLFNDLLDQLSERFFVGLHTSALEEVIRRYAARTSDWSRAELSKAIVAGLGVDLPLSDPGLADKITAFVSENVALVKSIPNQYFDQVEQLVTQSVREGKRYEEVAQEIERRFGVAQSSARMVARDQVSKFYSDLNQTRQEDLGVTGYVWRTMRDGRTRPEHQKREGKRFDWGNPPAGGHPGQATLCRCYAEPDLSPFLEAQ
jgi:SPP1 gp7 family putative phage head morphogenesis protein